MAEKDQGGRILIAHGHESIDDLRKRAAGESPEPERGERGGLDSLTSEFRRYADSQEQINQALQDQAIDFKQFVQLSQKEVAELVESSRRLTPKEERQRWTDAEYDQEFYTRFQPNQEPLFYSKLDTEDRRTYDARWQLARAAFVKKATANLPDKAKESQDLTLLGKEQMERLYRIPGVRQMLEGYVAAIVGEKTDGGSRSFAKTKFVVGTDPKTGNPIEKTLWEITDAAEFQKFRAEVRKQNLGSLHLDELGQKEADAVAWNLIWVTNLVESADSRYSFSGLSHRDLPGVICAGEYRHALHPQERFEGKSATGHFWGVFGTWGVNQMNRIKADFERSLGKDEMGKADFEFAPASRGSYWRAETTAGKSRKGGPVIRVFTPECYPLAPAGSFLEETTLETNGSTVTLLEMLEKGQEIPWKNDNLAEDMWGMYVTGKFNKAVQLMAFWEGDEKLSLVEGEEQKWTFPMLELFTRLKLEKKLQGLNQAVIGRDGKIKRPRLSYQSFHNFKVWAIIAGRMGVKKYEQSDVTLPFKFEDKAVFGYRLKHPKMGGYLEKNESIAIQ